MKRTVVESNAALWLTAPTAVLLAVAAGAGLFSTNLYRDAPSLVAQAIGQDLISLVIALPTLIIAAILVDRGSARAHLAWLGAVVYVVYTYVLYAFDIRFNALFLVYVALLGCALYALIGGLATTKITAIKASFTDRTPVRTVAIYCAVVASLFYALWLSDIVPALLSGAVPETLQIDGTPTSGVHVIDMAWILPAFVIAAVSLWRKQALGYTLAGALLSFLVLLIAAMLSMVAFLLLDGQTGVAPQIAIFGTLFAVSFGVLVWYLRNVTSV